MPRSHERIRKLPVHDHITHMLKIDIFTGHEKIGNLHFIPNIIFNPIAKRPKLYEVLAVLSVIELIACISSKLVQLVMEV